MKKSLKKCQHLQNKDGEKFITGPKKKEKKRKKRLEPAEGGIQTPEKENT